MKRTLLFPIYLIFFHAFTNCETAENEPAGSKKYGTVEYIVLSDKENKAIGTIDGGKPDFSLLKLPHIFNLGGEDYQVIESSLTLNMPRGQEGTTLFVFKAQSRNQMLTFGIPVKSTGGGLPSGKECPEEKHTCASSTNLFTSCNCCKFVRNKSNCITGCTCDGCANASLGNCLHTVEAGNTAIYRYLVNWASTI